MNRNILSFFRALVSGHHRPRRRTRRAGIDILENRLAMTSTLGLPVNHSLDSAQSQAIVGDANLDGGFDSQDLVRVFQTGEYEDGTLGNSSWAEGDWNGDGEFDSRDLVRAFQAGSYRSAAAVNAVHARPMELKGQDVAALDGLTLNFTASGTATHLGNWQVQGSVDLVPVGANFEFQGTAVFTAANGDLLNAELSGEFVPATGVATEFWTFTGGTGRFAGASGSTEGLSFNYPDGSFDIELEGNIVY
jgi:hypothetical protein